MAKNNAYASIPVEIKHEFYHLPSMINLPDAKIGEEYDYQLPHHEKYIVYGTTLGIPTGMPKGLKISLDGRITGVPETPAGYDGEVRLFRFLKAARSRTKMEVMKDVRLKIRVNPAN